MQIVGNAIVGGMESYVQRLVEKLPKDRFQVTVMVPYDSGFSQRLRPLPGVQIVVMPMPDDPPWASIASTSGYIRLHGVDVVQSHLTNAHLLGGLAGKLTGT